MGKALKKPNRFVTAIFILAIVYLYVPLGYLVIQTFLKDPNDIGGGCTLAWILQLLQNPDLLAPLWTSIEIGVLSATLAVLVGTLGAVGLTPIAAKLPVPVQTLILLPILLPEVITGLSLLLFFLLLRFELGFFTVAIAHASFSASFVYFIVTEQLRKLDPNLSEAAQDLGARPDQIFWKITVPNVLPGILGGWMLAFTLSFDDFLISFFTSGAGVTTLPLKIYSLMRLGISPELNGLSFLMILLSVCLVIALLLRRESREWVLKR